MEFLTNILDYIGRTNLFNFVIFLSIILFICKKISVKEKMEQATIDIANTIDASKDAKKESEEHLQQIEKSVSNIEAEIDEIIKKSETNATLVGENLLAEAEKNSDSIKDNMEKAIENSQNILRNDLIKRASVASIEVAKAHIVNELRNNNELHYRLIDESLNAIDEVEL